MRFRLLILICLLYAGGAEAVRIQDMEPEQIPKRQQDGYYAAMGVGFVNLDGRGVGVRAPLWFKFVSNRFRLISSANLLDLSFLEGDNRDTRYYRPFVNSTLCIDRNYNYRVPNYRCSGGTDVQISASADLAYIIADEVWIGNQPGKLFAGVGYRHTKPQTAYGTIGVFFDPPDASAGGFKFMFGEGYIALGLLWGFDLRRLF
ncbi:MAG TPA: hypothetical protein EYG11_24975 [Candidatus Latescibacteria bacterium]|nr:hypothetical protein [Candidatus Latescibacterota bacterium]